MKKKRQQKWFVKARHSYIANAWQGWLTYIPYTAYLVGALLVAVRSYSGFWTSVLIVVPNWAVAFAVMQWLAANKS